MSRSVMTNFTAADMPSAGSRKPAKKASRKRASQKQAKVEQAPADPNEVPQGTVNELLEWVGDDKDRAQLALDAETEKASPRSTAIDAFESIILRDDEPVEEETEEPEEPAEADAEEADAEEADEK